MTAEPDEQMNSITITMTSGQPSCRKVIDSSEEAGAGMLIEIAKQP